MESLEEWVGGQDAGRSTSVDPEISRGMARGMLGSDSDRKPESPWTWSDLEGPGKRQ